MIRSARSLRPVILPLLLLLVGCGRPAPGPEAEGAGTAVRSDRHDAATRSAHEAHQASSELQAGAATEHSLYLLPTRWRDRHGRELALDDLSGRMQVVAMVYTHCTFACPRILAQMKRIEGGVADAGLTDRVGFTLVSLDPERDTPGRLADFGEQLRLDDDAWTLLTGTDREVRALSVLLGVKYRAAEDGTIDHSNLLTVLDEDGVPVHRLEGLDANTDPVLRTILDHTRDIGGTTP